MNGQNPYAAPYINVLGLPIDTSGVGTAVQNFVPTLQKNFVPSLSSFAQGIADNPLQVAGTIAGGALGGLVGGVGAVPGAAGGMALGSAADAALAKLTGKTTKTIPEQFAQNIGNTVGGIAGTANEIIGSPYDVATNQLRPPSVARAITSFAKNPVGETVMLAPMITKLVKGENSPVAVKASETISKTPGVDLIRLPADMYGAAREAEVQNAVNKFVPGSNLAEKYANLGTKVSDIGQVIKSKSTLATSPHDIPTTEISSQMLTNLRNNGTFRSGILGTGANFSPEEFAKGEISNYLNQLYNDVQFKKGGTGAAVAQEPVQGQPLTTLPKTISSSDLYDMKSAANADLQNAYAKQGRGTPLKPEEIVSMAGRNALDQVLTKYHPDVGALNDIQSALYDAVNPLAKLRDKFAPSTGTGQLMGQATGAMIGSKLGPIGTMMGERIGGSLGNTIEQRLGVPLGEKAGNQVATNGLQNPVQHTFLPLVPPVLAGNTKTNDVLTSQTNQLDQTGSSIPRKSTYSISTPLESGIIEPEASFNAKQAQLQQRMGQEQLTDPIQYAKDQGQYQANQTIRQGQQPLIDISVKSKQLENVANNATNDLDIADPTFLNLLSKGWDAVLKSGNPAYAALATELQQLGNLSNVNLVSNFKTKEALGEAINRIVLKQQNDLNELSKQYRGGYGSATPVPVTQPRVNPVQSAPPKDAKSIMGGQLPELKLPALNLPGQGGGGLGKISDVKFKSLDKYPPKYLYR